MPTIFLINCARTLGWPRGAIERAPVFGVITGLFRRYKNIFHHRGSSSDGAALGRLVQRVLVARAPIVVSPRVHSRSSRTPFTARSRRNRETIRAP